MTITFENGEKTEHWCGWCREHGEKYDADKPALTDSLLVSNGPQVLVYGHERLLHLHEVTIMARGEETLRRTLARTVGRTLRRNAWRVDGSPHWGSAPTTNPLRQLLAAKMYEVASRLDHNVNSSAK